MRVQVITQTIVQTDGGSAGMSGDASMRGLMWIIAHRDRRRRNQPKTCDECKKRTPGHKFEMTDLANQYLMDVIGLKSTATKAHTACDAGYC
jgi:hypothetical protein